MLTIDVLDVVKDIIRGCGYNQGDYHGSFRKEVYIGTLHKGFFAVEIDLIRDTKVTLSKRWFDYYPYPDTERNEYFVPITIDLADPESFNQIERYSIT